MCTVQKPDYPLEILPRLAYRSRLKIETLLSIYEELQVVRMIDGTPANYSIILESGEPMLTQDVFKNSMANLSMHLSGGLFDTDRRGHLRFLPVSEKATDSWNGWRIDKGICKEKESYDYFETCFGLCFHVKDIHNRTFPFFRHFEDKEARDAYAKQVEGVKRSGVSAKDSKYIGAFENKRKNVETRPMIRIHHSPTRANYWHMTLDTYRPNETSYVKPGEKLNSADRNMFKSLKQDLILNYSINETPSYKITERVYFRAVPYYINMLLK